MQKNPTVYRKNMDRIEIASLDLKEFPLPRRIKILGSLKEDSIEFRRPYVLYS